MVRALDAERGLMKRVQKEEAWRDRALAAEQALKEALKDNRDAIKSLESVATLVESVATLVESFHQD